MIFGNINNLSEFPFLEEQVKECFEYAKTHDLASYEKGSIASIAHMMDKRKD